MTHTPGTPGDGDPVTIAGEGAVDVMIFAELTALLLGCLRNYRRSGAPVDLEGALTLEPRVAEALTKVRDRLPRPG